MPNVFDVQETFFTVLHYRMSYLEFFGTLTGAVAVVLAAKGNVWSWPVGLVFVSLLFFLFYQTQLYPDMLLQVFFFITNVIGWWQWTHPAEGQSDKQHELKVSWLSQKEKMFWFVVLIMGTVSFGWSAARLHTWLPVLFSQPSAFPYVDSGIATASIVATFLMMNKKAECWLFWLAADIAACTLYFVKDIRFLGFEYLLFCGNAVWGFWQWTKLYRGYSSEVA